jgi:hypothetical protein
MQYKGNELEWLITLLTINNERYRKAMLTHEGGVDKQMHIRSEVKDRA